MKKQVTIPATLETVSSFSAELDTLFEAVPLELRVKIVLALQELFVNIVKHAYAGVEGDITLDIQWDEAQLQIRVVDQAPKEFVPPEEVTAPDPFSLPEGGMGLFIVHQSFDHVEYTRRNNENIWQLQKNLLAGN
jgi:serine/threonine-protein kinase RsbW